MPGSLKIMPYASGGVSDPLIISIYIIQVLLVKFIILVQGQDKKNWSRT